MMRATARIALSAACTADRAVATARVELVDRVLGMRPSGAGSRSPGSGWSRRWATMWRRRGLRCSQAAAASRRSALFDASGFSTRIAAEVKDFDDDRARRRPQAAQVRQSLASLRARPRPSRRCATRASPRRRRPRALGLRGRHRHDGGRVRGSLQPCSGIRRPTASCIPTCWSTIRRRTDPMVFCRSQATAGLALLTRRFGIRGYATSVHTACASGGQAIGTALKLIRRGSVDYALAGGFDSMISPVGLAGFCLLSAVSADNDDAAAREPSLRRDAKRFRARRRRRLCGARGVGSGAPARRAHLRRACRRRQFAVVVPHHRFAAGRRRPDPVDARSARRRRRRRRRTSTTSMRTAHRPT